ncbi:hypothetical protein J1N35_014685 [Gossypium stocksii]|uniref:Uncharacterized protein n=1 Tax=Gossypium stocksii TaxID=47602 RepID=A0A9D3VWV7_9ROSI|nr:hypothetical protein J1N35_014685 [Gossypium stocksii]
METRLGCSQGGPSSKAIGKRPMQEFGQTIEVQRIKMITITHYNLTLEENKNFDPNKDDVSIGTTKAYSGSGKAGPKNKIIKDRSFCINRKLNRTIKNRGDQFKLTRNTRVSSSDSLKSVVELINAQLSNDEGRDSSIYDEKRLEEVGSSK